MKLTGILPFARELLQKAVSNGDVVVDATAGNGHDSLFLKSLVGSEGYIYSFDIQKSAIEATRKRLVENKAEKGVALIQDGHENMAKHIKEEHKGLISAAIFNLGYLPGSDKKIVTRPDTTIEATQSILKELKKEAIIVLVIYHGHEEGEKERDSILQFVRELPQEKYHVLKYDFINQKNNPPFIIAIEKR